VFPVVAEYIVLFSVSISLRPFSCKCFSLSQLFHFMFVTGDSNWFQMDGQ
jgi:hypothetical protein